YPKKQAASQPRAARLVKGHKPVGTPETPAAERKTEDQAAQGRTSGASEAAAKPEPPPGTASRTRIIKLAPKPAPTQPHAQPSTQAPRSTNHVAPPAEATPAAPETSVRSRRTTYIPPRSARPIGRHGKGPHKKAERFSDGPQARAFTAAASV